MFTVHSKVLLITINLNGVDQIEVKSVPLRLTDGKIRNVKILTLILQIALEVLSLIALAWLQMRRHNVETLLGTGSFWDVLFRIPEKYECQIGGIREHTFFNRSWEQLGLHPCNNGQYNLY